MRRKTNFFSYKPAIHGFSERAHNEPRNSHEIPYGSYLYVQGSQWKFD